jgi:hypothetical protein
MTLFAITIIPEDPGSLLRERRESSGAPRILKSCLHSSTVYSSFIIALFLALFIALLLGRYHRLDERLSSFP